MSGSASSEREIKCSDPGVQEFDLELPVLSGTGLPDELIHPRLGDLASALIIDIQTVRSTWRSTVDEDTKPHRAVAGRRTHDQIDVARVKAIHDVAVGLVQNRGVVS